MYPGVLHLEEVGEDDAADVVLGSLHPNHPGVAQVVVAWALVVEVWVAVGTLVLDEVVVVVVVFSSLQPNHPGVLQVDVEVVVVVVVLLLVSVPEVVVVSSKHPHHPGVWQVDVRVLVKVEEEEEDVVVLLLFPVTSFHKGQSKHSGVNLHSGAFVHILMTFSMTYMILWVMTETLVPLTFTISHTHSLPLWQALSRA
jgi:hypothetical protein